MFTAGPAAAQFIEAHSLLLSHGLPIGTVRRARGRDAWEPGAGEQLPERQSPSSRTRSRGYTRARSSAGAQVVVAVHREAVPVVIAGARLRAARGRTAGRTQGGAVPRRAVDVQLARAPLAGAGTARGGALAVVAVERGAVVVVVARVRLGAGGRAGRRSAQEAHAVAGGTVASASHVSFSPHVGAQPRGGALAGGAGLGGARVAVRAGRPLAARAQARPCVDARVMRPRVMPAS